MGTTSKLWFYQKSLNEFWKLHVWNWLFEFNFFYVYLLAFFQSCRHELTIPVLYVVLTCLHFHFVSDTCCARVFHLRTKIIMFLFSHSNYISAQRKCPVWKVILYLIFLLKTLWLFINNQVSKFLTKFYFSTARKLSKLD